MSKHKKHPTYNITIRKVDDHFEAEVVKPIAKVTATTHDEALLEVERRLAMYCYEKDMRRRKKRKK